MDGVLQIGTSLITNSCWLQHKTTTAPH